MFSSRIVIRHIFLLLLLPALSFAQQDEIDPVSAIVVRQLEDMRRELTLMRQVLEQQENKISRLERRLNQNYIELDRRVRNLRSGDAPDPAAEVGGVAPAAGDFRSRLQTALGFVESGQLAVAQTTLSELLLLEPEHVDAPLAWYWLGEVNLQLRKYEDAEQAFSYLIAVYEKHWRVPASAFKLGEVYRSRGELQKARIQYSRVVERYPDSPAARLSALAMDTMTRAGS